MSTAAVGKLHKRHKRFNAKLTLKTGGFADTPSVVVEVEVLHPRQQVVLHPLGQVRRLNNAIRNEIARKEPQIAAIGWGASAPPPPADGFSPSWPGTPEYPQCRKTIARIVVGEETRVRKQNASL